MRYAVEVTTGNGYRCSCCRSVSEDIEEFDNLEDAHARIAEIDFKSENYKRLKEHNLCGYDDDDRHVSDFYEIGEHLETSNDAITALKEEMLAGLAEKEAKAKKAKAKKVAAAKKAAETKRREQYEEMKKEYEA